MSDKTKNFQSSRPLKTLFNKLFEEWSKETRLDLSDLAELCGVSTAYLSQVARYGRIPSKPVLILLAFNFGIKDPQELFDASEITQPWPYPRDLQLQKTRNKRSIIDLNFDEDVFKDLVRSVVEQELRPRSLKQLTQGRALKVGINLNQNLLINKTGDLYQGFFYELIRQISLFLQLGLEFIDLSYLDSFNQLQTGEIDLYGPIYLTPQRASRSSFSDIYLEQGLSALIRKKNFRKIADLPEPKNLEEISSKPYVIAVLESTASSHFVINHCPDNEIIRCQSHQECLERIMLSVERQAHLVICDAGIAEQSIANDPDKLIAIKFNTPKTWLGTLGTSIAMRPDWRELQPLINSAIKFLKTEALMPQLYNKNFDSKAKNYLRLSS